MTRKFPKPQDDNDRRVIKDIRKHGCHIIHVGPDDEGPGWSYSIGLFHSYEQPEIMMFGVPWSAAETIINDLAARMKSGEPFSHGMSDAEVLDGHNVMYLSVPDTHYREHFGYAMWFYAGKAFPMLQLVWPDKKGLFPWDAKSTLDDSIQPLLGKP
jgi:hypothetical protein